LYGVSDAHRQFAIQNVDPCVLVLHAGDLYKERGLASEFIAESTKVQRLSFEYFTSRGCSTNRDEEVNWVTTIPNSLSLYPICCLGPC